MAKRNKRQVVEDRWDKKKAEGRVVKESEVATPVQALTESHKQFLKALHHKDVIIFSAPAGVGKSYVTMSEVSDWLKKGWYDKVTLARPSVGMGKSLGSLPGDLREKYEAYIAPMTEVVKERYGKGFYESSLHNGTIELVPLEYIRGRNFSHVVVVDEAQLMTPDEVYTVVTRMADGGKLILLGDPTQKDKSGVDGISWMIDFVKRHNLGHVLGFVEATSDDIVRGDICKAMVKCREEDNQHRW